MKVVPYFGPCAEFPAARAATDRPEQTLASRIIGVVSAVLAAGKWEEVFATNFSQFSASKSRGTFLGPFMKIPAS
jgi:hypothetical protein